MLISMVEAASCENPQCAEYAKLAHTPKHVRRYYCPTCSNTSPVRGIDAQLLKSPNEYATFLKRLAEFDSLPG
ncbi:MAG: hypothetical protein Q7N50_06200 [Armatimonadota bacterium]|nr:hypothetical protein [Armatimonadota bacterium]